MYNRVVESRISVCHLDLQTLENRTIEHQNVFVDVNTHWSLPPSDITLRLDSARLGVSWASL